jgi:hypoxanthine phosphoribosyltransferase
VATPARDSSEPGLGEVLVTAEDLKRRVLQLGQEISRDYAARPLLLIGVLKGAVFFLSDLMRYIDVPVEVDFMAVASYGSATDSSGVVRILKDLDASIEGRDVLIVEDIVDSGLTLQYLLRNLGSRNPRSLEVCALLTRAAQGRSAHALRRLRDPRPVRRRLRARLRRALPQPPVRRRSGALEGAIVRLAAPRPQAVPTAGKPDPAWYARALVSTTADGVQDPRNKP